MLTDDGVIGKSRESGPASRQAIGGLRPFQRGIIWSITSIKHLYNDLVVRYGVGTNLIQVHQEDNLNIFRCLNMDRLCYAVKIYQIYFKFTFICTIILERRKPFYKTFLFYF